MKIKMGRYKTMRSVTLRLTALTLAVAILIFANACGKKSTASTTAKKTTTTVHSDIDPLTGVSGLSSASIGKRPVAVVVENLYAARPQWGISTADIIIEGLAEGGITRLLCLYPSASQIPDQIGPIRSARVDFLEMAEGFDAIFVHWGGAASAYAAISSSRVNDVDGLKQGSYFARDTSRSSRGLEHTGYTTGSNIAKAISDLGYRDTVESSYANVLSFNKESKKASYTGGACNSIKIKYSNSFIYTFSYNGTDGKYYSALNGTNFNDASGTQLSYENVIILYFPSYSYIANTKGSIDMDLSGGNGVIVSNGTYENIKWEKGNTPSNPLKLYTESGTTLKLNAGKSYIGLVPASESSSTVIA